jgi:hypothetical protein
VSGPREERVVQLFDEFHERSNRGELPRPEEYAKHLGEAYPIFAKAIEGKGALDALLDPVAQPVPRVFGRYVLRREVGRGALGIVYEAEDRESGQRFAASGARRSPAGGCSTRTSSRCTRQAAWTAAPSSR